MQEECVFLDLALGLGRDLSSLRFEEDDGLGDEEDGVDAEFFAGDGEFEDQAPAGGGVGGGDASFEG